MPSLPSDVLLLAITHEGRYLTKGAVGSVLAGALMCDEAVARSPWTSTGIDRDEWMALDAHLDGLRASLPPEHGGAHSDPVGIQAQRRR